MSPFELNPSNVLVECAPAANFFAMHAKTEERLQLENPSASMQARLRPYFPISFGDEEVFFVRSGDVVIALGLLLLPAEGEPAAALSYITVDRRFRQQGVAAAIVVAVGDFLEKLGCTRLSVSDYTDMGRAHLRPALQKLQTRGIKIEESVARAANLDDVDDPSFSPTSY